MLNITECRAILEREGFKCTNKSFSYNNDLFAFIVDDCLFIFPDFKYYEKEKMWSTYSNKKAPYFELANKFIGCDGTEEELMILINAFKKNQKKARIEEKKRDISKDFQE